MEAVGVSDGNRRIRILSWINILPVTDVILNSSKPFWGVSLKPMGQMGSVLFPIRDG